MDTTIVIWIHQNIPNLAFFQGFFKFFTFFGTFPVIFLIITIAIIIFLFNSRFNKAHIVILSGVLVLLSSVIIKKIVARPRPNLFPPLDYVTNHSFPSGHALGTIVVYGILAFFLVEHYPKRKRVIYILTAVFLFLIGLSRIYLGVHWPSDILGGWLIGGTILTAVIWWYHKGGIMRTIRMILGGTFLVSGVIGLIIPIIPGILLIIAGLFLMFSDKSIIELLKRHSKDSQATGSNQESK